MDNVEQLGATENLDAKTMLLQAAEKAHNYEEVLIIARTKCGGMEKWSTTKWAWFLFACAAVITDLAMKSLDGKIINGRY